MTTKKYKTSFEINKLISISGLFSKIKMPASARLVLRAIADYWNYNRGEAFPTQKTLAYNTGVAERNVREAVKLLQEKNLITAKLSKKRYYYQFTGYFIRLITNKEENSNTESGQNNRNISDDLSANNIIKYNENTSFLNSNSEEDFSDDEELSPDDRRKMLIEKFKDNPALGAIVYKLKRQLTSSQEQ